MQLPLLHQFNVLWEPGQQLERRSAHHALTVISAKVGATRRLQSILCAQLGSGVHIQQAPLSSRLVQPAATTLAVAQQQLQPVSAAQRASTVHLGHPYRSLAQQELPVSKEQLPTLPLHARLENIAIRKAATQPQAHQRKLKLTHRLAKRIILQRRSSHASLVQNTTSVLSTPPTQ